MGKTEKLRTFERELLMQGFKITSSDFHRIVFCLKKKKKVFDLVIEELKLPYQKY